MTPRGEHRHTVDVVFVVALFCAFAASALAVIIIGIDVYKGTVINLNDHFTSRTATTYVTQKIRQNNSNGRVTVGQVGTQPAVVIAGDGEGAGTTTYLYSSQGELMELFVKDGTAVSPGQGQKITEITKFEPKQVSASLLCLKMTDTTGQTRETYVHVCPASSGEVTP